MKKSLFVVAIAAIALASCSQDDDLDVSSKRTAIQFRPGIGVESRASEITNANLADINVTAFMGDQKFFPEMTFSKEDGSAYFVSSPEYYWPADDSELTFYAYAPTAPGGTVSIESDAKTMTDFTVAPEIVDQVDFVTAVGTGKRSVNESAGMPLTFNHQLAQIEVRAKTANDVYTFAISGVRIGQTVDNGSFDFATSDWTLGTDKAIYSDTYDTPITLTATPASVMGQGGNAIVLPQQLTAWNPDTDAANSAKGAYLAVKLNVSTKATGVVVYPYPTNPDCDWAAIPIDTNLQAGKKYIYTLDFTHGAGYVDPNDPIPGNPVLGGTIKFTVDVVDWVDTPVDVDMTTIK